MNDFISPYIYGLRKLVEGEGYSTLYQMYESEKEKILKELHNATDDRSLRLIQGKYILLKKLTNLPETEIDKALASQKSGG